MTATHRKYLLITFFALAAYFGYQPLQELVLSLRGMTYAAPGLSCDYQGRTYREREQRQADDGCNACTCGQAGWTCTNIACAAGAGIGTVAGRLLSAGEGGSSAQRVCAMNLEDTDQIFCQQTIEGATTFALAAKPGTYWVYAARADDESGARAYWSEYVKCGMGDSCKDHSPVPVRVEAGGVSQVDPLDWNPGARIDAFRVTPSKWEYTTHNYYPDSVFLVKGKHLSSVRIFATAYPERPESPAYELGRAALASETESGQSWTLPVPKGFQAWTAYAIAENQAGETVRSYALRIIRPIETTY